MSGNQDYSDKPVFVLGFPRSGTSMVAGCLTLSGCWSGNTVPGGVDNPRGFFEHIFLRDSINKPLLRGLNADPNGVTSLPDLAQLVEVPPLHDAVIDVLHQESYDGSRQWIFKDAKLTLLWPIWAAAFPDATWVIVHRPADQIVKSCLNTGFMARQCDSETAWFELIDQYQIRLDRLKDSANSTYELDASELVAGNTDRLQNIVFELGLNWDEEQIRSFVEPSYWQRKQK